MLSGFQLRKSTQFRLSVRPMLELPIRPSRRLKCGNPLLTWRVSYSCEIFFPLLKKEILTKLLGSLSFHMFFNEPPSNTSQQLLLIVVGFGLPPAESALFNIIKPFGGFILILGSVTLLYSTRLGKGYTCAISYIPCFIGGIIVVSLINLRRLSSH